MDTDLIPIGRFSQMSRLSIKALRLYADQGLLAPAWIDPATGYRYYRERLEARLADQARMLRFLQRLIDQGGTLMPYDVTIESTPAQQVATWSTRTDLAAIGDAIGRGFATIAAAMSAIGAQPIGNPFVVYHDVIDAQADGTIEICIPASPGGAPAGVMSGRGHVPARCDRISRAVGSGRGGVPGSPGPR